DLVSNTFAKIMAEIFAYKNDENEKFLRNIGFNIGKYIYILDAYEDLEKDYKKNRYNPFIDYINKKEELVETVEELLNISLSILSKNLDSLNLKNNVSIIENIVYSGMYLKYKSILNKGCEVNV